MITTIDCTVCYLTRPLVGAEVRPDGWVCATCLACEPCDVCDGEHHYARCPVARAAHLEAEAADDARAARLVWLAGPWTVDRRRIAWALTSLSLRKRARAVEMRLG